MSSTRHLFCCHCKPWNAYFLHDCTANSVLVRAYIFRTRVINLWIGTRRHSLITFQDGSYIGNGSLHNGIYQRYVLTASTAISTSPSYYHVGFCRTRIWISFDTFRQCCLGGCLRSFYSPFSGMPITSNDETGLGDCELFLCLLHRTWATLLRYAWFCGCNCWKYYRSTHFCR